MKEKRHRIVLGVTIVWAVLMACLGRYQIQKIDHPEVRPNSTIEQRLK